MLSLSLGRDGWVEAAAPAPRIECAFLRCAAFVAVQLFLCLRWLHTGGHQAWMAIVLHVRVGQLAKSCNAVVKSSNMMLRHHAG